MSHITKVTIAWGDALPDWVRALAERAAAEFQPLGSVHRTMRGACQSCPHNGGSTA